MNQSWFKQPKAYYRASTMKIEDGLIYIQPTSFHCSQPIGTFDLEHAREFTREREYREIINILSEKNPHFLYFCA